MNERVISISSYSPLDIYGVNDKNLDLIKFCLFWCGICSKEKAISAVVNGLAGEVVVNGSKFNSVMPKLDLSDEIVANVLTYVYSQWDNNGSEVTPDEVKAVRAKGGTAPDGGHE